MGRGMGSNDRSKCAESGLLSSLNSNLPRMYLVRPHESLQKLCVCGRQVERGITASTPFVKPVFLFRRFLRAPLELRVIFSMVYSPYARGLENIALFRFGSHSARGDRYQEKLRLEQSDLKIPPCMYSCSRFAFLRRGIIRTRVRAVFAHPDMSTAS